MQFSKKSDKKNQNKKIHIGKIEIFKKKKKIIEIFKNCNFQKQNQVFKKFRFSKKSDWKNSDLKKKK